MLTNNISLENLLEVGKIIKEARENKKYTTRRLAELTGITSNTEISMIENAKRKKPDPLILRAICKILDINYIQIFKILGYIDKNDETKKELEKAGLKIIENELIKMPVYSGVSAGNGTLCYGEVLFYDYFPIMKNMDTKFNIQVVGDSMEPMIPNGAIVTINEQPDLDNGEIGVFIIDEEEGFVKKFYREDKFIRLVSLNPEYKDRIILPNEEFRIAGKVIKVTYTL